jgi:hypothetical protein
MFADLSSDTANKAEIWRQMTPGVTSVPRTRSSPHSPQAPSCAWPGAAWPDLIPDDHGRASVSEDALRRNAAVAAGLSSIRQSWW